LKIIQDYFCLSYLCIFDAVHSLSGVQSLVQGSSLWGACHCTTANMQVCLGIVSDRDLIHFQDLNDHPMLGLCPFRIKLFSRCCAFACIAVHILPLPPKHLKMNAAVVLGYFCLNALNWDSLHSIQG
jgi:hypothetical protein